MERANWFEMQLATKNKSKSRTIPRRFRKLRKPSVGPPFERIGDPQIPPTRQNSSVSCPSRRTPEPWRLRCTPELFPVRGLLSGGFCGGFLSPLRLLPQPLALTVFFALADFFATVACDFCASARFNAQRFLVASLMAFLPAALNLRFIRNGLGAAG